MKPIVIHSNLTNLLDGWYRCQRAREKADVAKQMHVLKAPSNVSEPNMAKPQESPQDDTDLDVALSLTEMYEGPDLLT